MRDERMQNALLGRWQWLAILSLMLGVLGAPSGAAAADGEWIEIGDLPIEDILEEIVVATAGKRAQDMLRSPSAVSVITREEIDAMPYLYLGELLGTQPGFDSRWDKMQRFFVGLRGLSGSGLNSRTLILVDGQPINDPLSGEASAGHWMPLADVERIEVIRGPGSSLYGANAFSGVVNVITRHGMPGASRELRADLLVGSDQTARLQASAGREVGPVSLLGSFEVFRTDGWFPEQQLSSPEGVTTFDNDDATRLSATGSAHVGDLSVIVRYLTGERGRPGQFPTDSHGDLLECDTCHTAASAGFGSGNPTRECGNCHLQENDREQTSRLQAVASYDAEIGERIEWSTSAYHTEWRTEYDVHSVGSFLGAETRDSLLTKQRSGGGETHLVHSLDDEDTNTLLVGAEVRYLEAASQILRTPEDGQRVTEAQFAAFVEDEVRPVPWLSLVGGLRLDQNSRFGLAFSPRGGVVVAPNDRGSVRFSAARAFRNPNFAELYIDSTQTRISKKGNAALAPEWITTLETGATYQWTKPALIRLSVAGFYSQSQSLIALSGQVYPDITSSFNNDGEHAEVLGAELELIAERDTGDSMARVSANLSIQDARDGSGDVLAYAPAFKGNITMFHDVGPIEGLVRIRYVGPRLDNTDIELPQFATVDLALGPHLNKEWTTKIWIRNLTGDAYQESLGIPAAGRSFFLEVRYRGEMGG